MAVEAVLSRYKKNNIRIFIAVLVGLAIWCVYDGYFNEKFIEEHTANYGTEDAQPYGWLVVNRKAPPFLIGGAAVLAAYLFKIKGRKISAAETELTINGNRTIAYDKIERIDKTYFDSRGYFVLTYLTDGGAEANLKLSDRTYDNLSAVLDEIVAKIT